jgi:uncharacterized protein YggE
MNPETNKALQLFLNASTGFLGLLVVILTIGAVSMYRNSASVNNYTDTIEVQGVGTVKAVPDVAKITFGHREENKDLKTAQAGVEKVIGTSLEALKKFGIEEKDIDQVSYNAYPQYDYKANCSGVYCIDGNRELSGYEVSQSIEVTVRNIDQAGEVLGLLGQSGVTELSGPYFEIDDPSVYQQEARSLAIEDARREAEIIANNLGVRLGKMVDFYESMNGYPAPYMSARDGGMDIAVAESADMKAVSIPVGEDEFEMNVTLVFKIK